MKPMTLIAAAGLASLALASPAAAATTQYEGTVLSVNRDAHTFKLRDSERGTIRIKVNSSTAYQRISGFAAVKKGLTRVEALVKRSNGRWVAVRVERSGGGGGHHGGDDD
jgi:hypothetical protein